MEKLELRNIIPYLPYGVNVIFNNEIKGILCGVLTGLLDLEVIEDYDNNTPIIKRWCSLDTKPILRPLSDLTKEIEHNGERFVPIHKINFYGRTKELYPKSFGICDREINSDLTTYGGGSWEGGLEDDIDTFQFYELYDKLFEWHFDVFGLINKGLAIDVNSL